MRRIGPLLMSTVLVAGCAGVATNTESLRVLLERSGQSQPKLSAYEQGKRHLQFKSPGLAVAAFEQALKENPDSVAALNGLAVAYDRLGRADVAQRYLDRALTLDPNSAVTLNNLAYLNLVQGNTAVALAYAERAKIAADMPMDMMLPETIASAVDRTAEIASQIATNEKSERQVAQTPPLPPESDIKRVGLNEWELRIRPPNPADAVRINLPAPNATPRVIAPMTQPVLPPISADSLTEAVMVSDIPDWVMADLMAPSSEAAPQEAVVAALPQSAMPETVSALPAPMSSQPAESLPPPDLRTSIPMPEFRSPASEAIAAMPRVSALLPQEQLPEPVHEEPLVVDLPTFRSPASEAIAPMPRVSALLPLQPSPEPVREEPLVVDLPAFRSPASEAIAPMPRVSALLPQQVLPEPVREEPMVVEVLAPQPLPRFNAPTTEAIAAMPRVESPVPLQRLPEPIREEPMASPEAYLPPPSEPARSEQVMASLAMPAPQSRVPLPVAPEPDINRSAAEVPKPAQPVAPLAAPPAAELVTPMVASLAPSGADASRAASPSNVKADWRAFVPSSTLVRVSNGTGRRLMASRFARYFGEHSLTVRRIANANSFNYRRTVIFYNPDQRAHAEALAAALPFSVRLAEAKQGRGQIELILGFDLLGLDDTLRSA